MEAAYHFRFLTFLHDSLAMTSFENFTFTFSFLHVGRPTKAIDHHSFPHIVDLIFEFATFDTLLLLGQVCREWRSRVDAELYHLHDFRASSRYDSKQQGDDWWKHPKYDYYFETASGKPGKLPDVTRLSGTTKIIDLSYRAMSYGADTRAPIDDMRLPEPRWEVDSDLFRTPFAPHRLVFNNHFDTDLPFDEVPRLVVNYRDDEFYVLGVVGNEVELLVFIVHGGSYRQAADWGESTSKS